MRRDLEVEVDQCGLECTRRVTWQEQDEHECKYENFQGNIK